MPEHPTEQPTGATPRPEQEPVDAEIVPTPQLDPAAPAAPPTPPLADYDERGVPSFDHVRDRIEGRYATSVGAAELAEETPAGRSAEEQQAARDDAGRARLEEIRRSLGR